MSLGRFVTPSNNILESPPINQFKGFTVGKLGMCLVAHQLGYYLCSVLRPLKWLIVTY